jgi:chromosomal replication initiation ATPase DnaA
MNEHIIQSYIDNVTMHYGLTDEFIFSKGQTVERTEPRQMFFYLCHKKGIPVVVVQKMLLDKYGFDMHHATILQSIRKIAEKFEGDEDYTTLMNKLMNVSVNV